MTSVNRRAAVRGVAAVAAAGLGATTVLAAPAAAEVTIGDGFVRVFGENRYETAVAIANNNPIFGECSSSGNSLGNPAIVATGQGYADALAGASVVGAAYPEVGNIAPILLTESDEDELNSETADYLDDCNVKFVAVLGEEDAVPESVYEEIEAIVDDNWGGTAPDRAVERVGGDNRYETAVDIAVRFLEERDRFGDLKPADDSEIFDQVVFLATGQQYPDALTAGPQATGLRPTSPSTVKYKGGHGILLTRSDELPDVTEDFLEDWIDGDYGESPHNPLVVILGGTDAVSEGVEDDVEAIDEALNVVRVGGANRYATATALWTLLEEDFKYAAILDNVGLASGQNFPDALTSASYLGVVDAPLVLVKQGTPLPAETDFFLKDYNDEIDTLHVFGGTDAISQAVVLEAVDAANGS